MTKANIEQQERYKGGVVPMEDIEKHSPTLRTSHSKVTDAQADLVHMMVATQQKQRVSWVGTRLGHIIP